MINTLALTASPAPEGSAPPTLLLAMPITAQAKAGDRLVKNQVTPYAIPP